MTIEPHRLVVKTQTRGRGPRKASKIVTPSSHVSYQDLPQPTTAGELRMIAEGDASLRNDASQLAKMYICIDLPGTGLTWVRVSVSASGRDSRTGRAWNHLTSLQSGL